MGMQGFSVSPSGELRDRAPSLHASAPLEMVALINDNGEPIENPSTKANSSDLLM